MMTQEDSEKPSKDSGGDVTLDCDPYKETKIS